MILGLHPLGCIDELSLFHLNAYDGYVMCLNWCFIKYFSRFLPKENFIFDINNIKGLTGLLNQESTGLFFHLSGLSFSYGNELGHKF